MSTVKQLHDAAMDAAYDYVDQADVIRVLTTYALDDSHATVVTNTLASTAMTPDTDYTKADGDAGNGSRKVTMAAKNGVSVGTTGTATQVALTKTSDTTVRLVTTCTSQALTSGNTVNIPAWKHEFGIPS
jgi:hypothetical protein